MDTNTYAVLDGTGLCINVIVCAPTEAQNIATALEARLVSIDANAGGPGIDWTYAAGSWTPPSGA